MDITIHNYLSKLLFETIVSVPNYNKIIYIIYTSLKNHFYNYDMIIITP